MDLEMKCYGAGCPLRLFIATITGLQCDLSIEQSRVKQLKLENTILLEANRNMIKTARAISREMETIKKQAGNIYQAGEGATMSRKLKPEYEVLRQEFENEYDDRGCYCHLNPPCDRCVHPGNPLNLKKRQMTPWEDDQPEVT